LTFACQLPATLQEQRRARTVRASRPIAAPTGSGFVEAFAAYTMWPGLLAPELVELADLFLDFAGNFFTGAFGFQFGIVAYDSGNLFNLALHLVQRTFKLVLSAGFHGVLLLKVATVFLV
jgi:hypothetical protein